MGLNFLASSHSAEILSGPMIALSGPRETSQSPKTRIEVVLPNPDPRKFNIEKIAQTGTYICALVNYPGCTNYEGRKILVFENTSEQDLTEATTLDPHFIEGGNLKARLRPDDEGWEDALLLARIKSEQSKD